ncbi:hypothetical protein Tco_0511814 [Tanacetum coccineum]
MRPTGDALRKCILEGPYTPTTVVVPAVPATENSPAVPEQTTVETVMNMTPENRAHFESEKLKHIKTLIINYQSHHKSYAPTQKLHFQPELRTTRYKGKEIAKPLTPPSESASEEDSDPEQAPEG